MEGYWERWQEDARRRYNEQYSRAIAVGNSFTKQNHVEQFLRWEAEMSVGDQEYKFWFLDQLIPVANVNES